MSSRRTQRLSRSLFALIALSLTTMVGCWEQWSNDWFPQMKWQKAVQAYEEVTHAGQEQGFVPPEGTVPIDGGEAPVSNVIDAASDVLVNPRPANFASIENGRVQYERFCATCHGLGGLGDGPVSVTGEISGPLAGVLALAGPMSIARIRSDGHIYTTIRYGRRRMPNYNRIQPDDRWDIVNYLRYLGNPNGSLK
ncbi:MAG: cytochrome c [Myxococcota bacterium]